MDSFTKRRADAPAGFFDVEAAGLRWLDPLRRTSVVNRGDGSDGSRADRGVPVAEVLAVDANSITLARIHRVRPTPQAARLFGRQLAATHDAGASAFGVGPDGWDGDGFIGDAPLTLRPHDSWGAFYAAERVLPYARAALRGTDLAVVEALATRLAAGEFDDDAPPARIHGDLWSGNVLFNRESATLIDPAAHGGHRVTDLAMLALFGLHYLDEAYAGYAAASTHLPDGWRDLIGLHQLHPLLVHAVLFGGGYGAQAVALARRY